MTITKEGEDRSCLLKMNWHPFWETRILCNNIHEGELLLFRLPNECDHISTTGCFFLFFRVNKSLTFLVAAFFLPQ